MVIPSVCLLITASLAQDRMTKDQFREVYLGALHPIETITLEYKGTYRDPSLRGPLDDQTKGLKGSFTGKWRSRPRDGAMYLEIYHREPPENRYLREVVAVLNEKVEQYDKREDEPYGSNGRSEARRVQLERIGSIERIYSVNLILGYLRDPEVRMLHEGTEMVDGRPCEVVAFSLDRVPDMTAENATLDRFWVDLERSGQAVRRETRRGRKELHVKMVAELRPFPFEGRSVWFPVVGRYEAYLKGELQGDKEVLITTREPVLTEDIEVNVNSVKFNLPLKDQDFKVDARVIDLGPDGRN